MVSEKRHNYIVVVLIIAVVLIVSSVMIWMLLSKKSSHTSSGEAIRITGTALCLPHTDTGGPQTMECGIGILDDKGQYYALNDSDNNYHYVSELPMNQRVTIEGTLDKVVNSLYPIKGTIHISKIER